MTEALYVICDTDHRPWGCPPGEEFGPYEDRDAALKFVGAFTECDMSLIVRKGATS